MDAYSEQMYDKHYTLISKIDKDFIFNFYIDHIIDSNNLKRKKKETIEWRDEEFHHKFYHNIQGFLFGKFQTNIYWIFSKDKKIAIGFHRIGCVLKHFQTNVSFKYDTFLVVSNKIGEDAVKNFLEKIVWYVDLLRRSYKAVGYYGGENKNKV